MAAGLIGRIRRLPEETEAVTPETIRILIRHFRENGLKVLLSEPGNLHELLGLLQFGMVHQLETERLEVDPTTYIVADYRHLASDLVLHVPMRTGRGRQSQKISLYILIEHQSMPDEWMIFWVLEYVVQIYKHQIRKNGKGRKPGAKFRLNPVLPIVLYTGERRWDALGQLSQLIHCGE